MTRELTVCVRRIQIVLALVLVSACGQTQKTEREGEPDIYSVGDEDEEMNKAIMKSRATFDDFLSAYNNKKEDQTDFSVKMPFATESGAEHIWLVDISMKDGKLFGQVDNLPESVTNIQLGDTVEIQKEKISDWFYVEGNKLIGGLTIRVLRDRMSFEEREQFDMDYGLEF